MLTIARRPFPTRASYGFDVPGVMLTMLGLGAAGTLVGGGLALTGTGALAIVAALVAAVSLVPLGLGLAMLAYGLLGKRRMRDYMLGLIAWRGDERVLDVGTGGGLLLIGAAKRLGRRGQATGIDIWRPGDLSGNSLDRLAENVALEGVEDRVALRTEDARTLSFDDGSFDVVVSLSCIHTIADGAERRRALLEIARVLKPGGRALVAGWVPTHAYAETFRAAGLVVNESRGRFGVALAPMWLVDARKPGPT
jgi:SAM-dependent methyltransferase